MHENPLTTADYQILIVGAGLAGLHCALRLKEKFPRLRIAIAEAYGYVGGRVVTYNPPKFPAVHWENGAGRIHSSHTLLLNYVKRFRLHLSPLSSTVEWRDAPTGTASSDPWPSFSRILESLLSTLKPSVLSSYTIAELLSKLHGPTKTEKLLEHFPYRAELFTMRADMALKSLSETLGSNDDFFVVREGLGALIQTMKRHLESLGVVFLLHHRLSSIPDYSHPITCKFQVTDPKTQKRILKSIRADKVILALHSEALKAIHPFQNLPILKHLKMEPLLRTYAIFPTPAWFEGLPRTVTQSPLRHVIPVNPAQGTIMTSYTDSKDTKPWLSVLKKGGNDLLEEETLNHLRSLFSGLKIPDPLFFKSHPWKEGCTYWTPGLYSPAEESMKIMQPLPLRWEHVYVCGESFSLRQAWMEGALEHAELMLQSFFL